ncbi:MAG: pilus assembly protein, partial [Lysobacter sp.]
MPATYNRYNGGDVWAVSSYTRTAISSGTTTYSGEGRESRTDCGSPATGTCTYEQEIQNFANWYTYYRSRILAARAGIGRAFSTLSSGATAEAPAPRVGFTTINTTNPANGIVRDIRVFSGADRTNFFNSLYGVNIPVAATPLRLALDNVGQYYKTDLPWDATPGTSSAAAQLACRASYSILMTDGYWNGSAAATAGAALDVEDGLGEPFEDGFSNTLADVAAYYWKNDLRTSLDNKVPVTGIDTQTQQHMVTFGVGLGVTGTIDRDTAFAAISTRTNVPWLEPSNTNKATKIDDLLHAAVNSRGDFFSASDPTAFADGLSKVLTSISDRVGSASNVAANSVALKDDTRLFQASYKPGTWSGELQSFPVTAAGVGATAQWSASAGIPTSGRKLFTSTGATTSPGAVFPTAAQTTAWGNSAKGHSIAAYLAGTRTGEIKGTSPETGDLRRRPHLLGDIVNSSPAYVKDTDTLYVGANDGMMHAVNAGTGAEVFAYVPNAVSTSARAKLKLLSSPNYSHKFFVDGPIAVSSRLETPGKNYLVGTLGRGGKGVYFLDVTTPSTFAIANVTAEYGEDQAVAANPDDLDLGYILGKPIIANLAIGTGTPVDTPVAIVSNGVNSANGRAGLYVFNLATGALIQKILTGSASDTGNGLS